MKYIKNIFLLGNFTAAHFILIAIPSSSLQEEENNLRSLEHYTNTKINLKK